MPIKRPLRFVEANCNTRIKATENTPAPPTPEMARPTIKCLKDLAEAVTKDPKAKNMVEKKIHRRGEKVELKRPITGAKLDIETKYAEVNQLTSSYASRSAAIED